MLTHSIAGLTVGIDYKYPRLTKQAAAYVTAPAETDFDISIADEIIEKIQENNPHLTLGDCEYIQTGAVFYKQLVSYNGMLLHASAVIKDGYVYLFSAPSGTGKSTHTELWMKKYPDARIINDDKPAIRVDGDNINVYGTPWSGKSDLNLNLCIPIGGICFLERSKENFINRISSAEAIPLMMNQTVRPRLLKNMDKLLDTLGKIVENTPVYKMGCNISEEAAVMAYETMRVK